MRPGLRGAKTRQKNHPRSRPHLNRGAVAVTPLHLLRRQRTARKVLLNQARKVRELLRVDRRGQRRRRLLWLAKRLQLVSQREKGRCQGTAGAATCTGSAGPGYLDSLHVLLVSEVGLYATLEHHLVAEGAKAQLLRRVGLGARTGGERVNQRGGGGRNGRAPGQSVAAWRRGAILPPCQSRGTLRAETGWRDRGGGGFKSDGRRRAAAARPRPSRSRSVWAERNDAGSEGTRVVKG